MQTAIKVFKKGGVDSNKYNLVKETLTICGATSETTECCVIALAHLSIDDWAGTHKFVITESLVDKDMILGRDFMKAYKVVIDHGTDEI
jgi:hypothetical protein